VRIAVFWPDYGWTVNPHRLTITIIEDFVRQGGAFLKARVLGIQTNGSRAIAVMTGDQAIPVDQIVIAAGARSKRFAADLGTRVCLEPERGYHLSLPDAGISLNRTVMSFERFISATPMEDGLRISGISEFAGLDAPPRMELTRQVADHAREMFPGIRLDGASPWVGERPSTPDSLPIIGRASSNPNAYFAFGHFGLTLGAITGRLIAELATGRPTTVDLSPFRPDRF
jgi:D-amino-acid dehydrogenase